MIFFEMYSGYDRGHEFFATNTAYDKISIATKQFANKIFYFKNGKTEYIKDRSSTSYQYSDEEQVVLKLRTVLQ